MSRRAFEDSFVGDVVADEDHGAGAVAELQLLERGGRQCGRLPRCRRASRIAFRGTASETALAGAEAFARGQRALSRIARAAGGKVNIEAMDYRPPAPEAR